MKQSRLLIVVLALLLIAPGFAFGQKVGTTGVNFLKIGPTSRGVALADAFLPIADDVSALWYNPGGLVNVRQTELALTHVDYPGDLLAYDFLGYVKPLPAQGAAVGVQLFGLYSGAIDETTPERPFGTGRTFTASDIAAGVTYAQRLTDKFSIGTTVKYLQENLADESAFGWAVDVGTFYDTGWKSLQIAMLISNFGPDMEFVSTPFPMPIMFKFGIAADLMKVGRDRLTMAFEGTHPNDNVEELHIGFEYAFNELAFLRIGKKFNGWQRSYYEEYLDDPESKDPFVEYPLFDEDGQISFHGLSLGGGLVVPGLGLGVDYAYAQVGYLGSIHRFSLSYKLR